MEPIALLSENEIEQMLGDLRRFESFGFAVALPKFDRRPGQSTATFVLVAETVLRPGLSIALSSSLEKQGVGSAKRLVRLEVRERTGSMAGVSELFIEVPYPNVRFGRPGRFFSKIGHMASDDLLALCKALDLDQLRTIDCGIGHDVAEARSRMIASWAQALPRRAK